MVSFGGPWVMAVGALVAAGVCGLLALVAQRSLGRARAWSLAGCLWSLVVIALVTLVPANGPPGVISAEAAQTSCSFDLGGPAPDGFWIFGGGQRLLNTVLFVPAGLLWVLTIGRRRWWLALLGIVALAAYSCGIELTQLELTRLDRACDVTDVVDNTTGAVIGTAAGLVAVSVAWLARRARLTRLS